LIIFIGIAGGLLVGTVWVIVRDWLPRDPPRRLLFAGLLAVFTGSAAVVDAENRDFQILDPPALHVAMFVLLVGLTGIATAGFDGLLEQRLPSGQSASVVFGGLAGLGLVFALPFLGVFLFFDAGRLPTWPGGLALIAVAVATITGWAGYYADGEAGLASRPAWHRRLGVGGVALFGLLGAARLASEIEAIL
jgi:hypothetical protein